VIRIGMYAWFDNRGDYLAREVRRKWNHGCSVRIVYSVLNSKVKRILYDPSGRGRIPMRRVVRIDELTRQVVDYNHSKYLAMSGTYRHQGGRFVWSGSMNFTGLGLSATTSCSGCTDGGWSRRTSATSAGSGARRRPTGRSPPRPSARCPGSRRCPAPRH
jgi:hypothetical protein